MKTTLRFFTIVIISALQFTSYATSQQVSQDIIEKSRKAVVNIDTRSSLAAYISFGSWYGTGFLADKKTGLIVTNAHVVGPASISTYFVTFHNGQQKEAKLVYYDLYQDYAILKVLDINSVSDIEEILFSKTPAKENQFVFLVGNNEGKGVSFHTGYISDVYSINGEMPQHSYIVNLNTTGGSSGSPLLNEKGECIGLNYGGGDTFALSLRGEYIQKGLEAAKTESIPTRKSVGAIYKIYSLDKAIMHRDFNKDIAAEYMKKFPDARNKVIAVHSIINGYQAQKVLEPGDIIWEVDGTQIGPNLYQLDDIIDKTRDSKLKFVVFRDGSKKEIMVEVQDLKDRRITKLVNFGGATFFEADDFAAYKAGVDIGSLLISNVQSGSSFSSIPLAFQNRDQRLYRLNVTHINNYRIHNLNELIHVLPKISKNKFLKIEAVNHQPYYGEFGSVWQSGHEKLVSDVILDGVDSKYRVFNFDHKKFEWIEEGVLQKTDSAEQNQSLNNIQQNTESANDNQKPLESFKQSSDYSEKNKAQAKK